MCLTTLRVCLLKAIRNTARDSLVYKSIVLGLMTICFTFFTGCSGGNSEDGPLDVNARIGNGKLPTISLSPTNFSFSVTQGDANPVHTVNISNAGKGTLNWSLSATTPWLTLSPSSGTSSGNTSAIFTATANLSGLVAGTYSATITVIGDSATNSPQNIPVTLIIAPSTSSSTPTSPTTVSAALAWDAVTEPSVSGYYVHYGAQSPNLVGSCAYARSAYYSLASLVNASSPTATISGLTTGMTYYFAVSAYTGSIESPCSNEISEGT